jgi:GntR family transcriptional regulator
MLVSDGTLERRRGIGTFVSLSPLINIREGLETLVSTTEVIRAQGYEPGTSYSHWETVAAGDSLGEVFGLAPDAPLVHFSRTRTANGVPVIHCEEYVATSLLEHAALDDLQDDWSLYKVIKDTRWEIVSAVCKVVPVVADDNLAARLKVAPRHPLLLLRQTHFAAGQKAVLYCENYHNSSVIEFHILRRP